MAPDQSQDDPDRAPRPAPAATGEGGMLEDIGRTLDDLNLGFDANVLKVLDDERARPAQIEDLKEHLGELVAARLFGVANSNYYGGLRSGRLTRFTDVVMHLGTDATKSMAIFIALMALAHAEDLKAVFARNFATSRLAEILAVQLGLRARARGMVALGGLFVEMGRVIMDLHMREHQCDFPPGFVERWHPKIGARVIARFGLPQELAVIVDHEHFSFHKDDGLSPAAVVDLAHGIVERSFLRHGRLVIESAMPDPEGILYSRTIGSLLAGQFQSIALGAYIHVVPAALSEQEQRLYDKRKQQSGDS